MKRILIVVDGTENDADSLAQAAVVCRAAGAALTVAHPRRQAAPTPGFAAAILGGSRRQDDDAAAAEAAARAAFDRICGDLAEARFRAFDSDGARLIAGLGYAHDLVVVERLDREEGPAAAELNAALFDTGRPVLIAPPARPAAMPDCCVIAWNGAVQAARAIASALPFLQAAGRVQILVGRGTAGFDTGPLRDYLAAHGVTAEPVAYDSERLTARARGRALLAAAAEAGCDLLVAGAYGEGSSVDDVAGLGRATRKVVTAARFPVLLQA